MKTVYTPKREGTANDWSENKMVELNPKDKALEIAMKFDKEGETDNAVKCAKIAVDEIIRLANRSDLFNMRTKRQHVNNSLVDETYVEYWDQVKKEIEKL